MKKRNGPNGIQYFWRDSGLNILFDEIIPPESAWATAPRQVSIALTNSCDLSCEFCYAPKHGARLCVEKLFCWLHELDIFGCLSVGFGGGEPTLHSEFAAICEYVAKNTSMAVTFTTHGHRLTPELVDQLAGNVNFVRVSVDGVGDAYEQRRGRKFSSLISGLREAKRLGQVGLNVVISELNVAQLNAIADLAETIGASELLLLPQQATKRVNAAGKAVLDDISAWIANYQGRTRLALSATAEAVAPTIDPLNREKGMREYAHIDASGIVKANSFANTGIAIGRAGVMAALRRLEGEGCQR